MSDSPSPPWLGRDGRRAAMSTRQSWFPIRHRLPLCGAVLDTAVQGYRPSTPCGISFPNQHRLPLCGAVLDTAGQGYAASITSRLTS